MLALLLSSVAAAAECTSDIEDYIVRLETGEPEAYRCLAELDDAGPVLLEQAEADGSVRVTRALAVHWMSRLDEPLPAEVARALRPSDRRILADAVRARRGRQSPSPVHHEVFSQLDWYQPHSDYTDARLSPIDRNNISMLANPPPPPPPPAARSAAEAIAEVASTPATARGCQGCSGGDGTGLIPVLFPLFMIARRQS